MNNQSQQSGYVLSCNGVPIKSLSFMPSTDSSYMGVYAQYNNSPTWSPLGIELPFQPTLQQVRDANRNILLNAGSYENAHFYLRSAEGNNVTTAFYTNADGGAIQAGDTDSYTALNLQPLGGTLNYGGQEVATKNWVFGINNGDADAAGFVRSGQPSNNPSTFNDLGTKSSYMGSLYANGNTPDGTSNTYWNVISAKHRNGMGDGVNYGLQIANIMSHGGSPNSGRMWFRNQFNGYWGNWHELATQNWVTAQIAASVPSLQAVTGVGNTTTNNIQLTGGINGSSLVLDATTSSYKILSASSAGWARGLSMYDATGVTLLNSVGFYGSAGNTFNYGYAGTAYNNAILKWNASGIGIGLGATVAPSYLLDVNRGTISSAAPIAQFAQNGGNISIQNGSTGTADFNPVIKGTFAGTNNAYGLCLIGNGADSYTNAAVTLRGANTGYTGGITGGNLLELQNYTTKLMSVDYLGNLKLPNGGSFIKTNVGQSIKVINNVAEFNPGNVATTGCIAIKHAVPAAVNLMQDFKIKIWSYALARLAEIRVSFILSAAGGGAISATGKKAYIVASSSMPSGFENINVGFDSSGNLTVLIGDITTAWSTYLKVTVEQLILSHSNWNAIDWESGWSVTSENNLSAYTGIVNIPIDTMATQTWVNSAISSSTNFIQNQSATDQSASFRVSGTGRVGTFAIGNTGSSNVGLYNRVNITGATGYGQYALHDIQTDVTAAAYGTRMTLNFVSGASPSSVMYYRITQGTLGGSNTVSTQYGIYIDDMTVASTNVGIFSNISAGAGKSNLNISGTAINYLAGNTYIGSGSLPTDKLEVNGNTRTSKLGVGISPTNILDVSAGNIAGTFANFAVAGGGLQFGNSGGTTTAAPTITFTSGQSTVGSYQLFRGSVDSYSTGSAVFRTYNASGTGGLTGGKAFVFQNYTNNIFTVDYQGVIGIPNLIGTGIRIVVADSSGNLSSITNNFLTSMSGTANRISVTGTTIDIASTYAGQTSITTLGTIGTGTWNGTTIAVNKGGTGTTSLTGLVVGNGTAAMTAVTGTASQLLRRNAANTAYEFFTPNFTTSNIYTADGTISGNRIITTNGHSLTFSGGAFSVDSLDFISIRTIGDSIEILSNVGISIGTASSYNGYIQFTNLTGYRNWYLPDKNGTFAVLDDLQALTLQDVATAGNSFSGDLVLGISGSELYVGSTAVGDGNTRLGRSTLMSVTNGNWNTAVGSEALKNFTTGNNNTAVGEVSLLDFISGYNNTAIGDSAGIGVTGGNNNVYLGMASGQAFNGNRARGDNNTFIGRSAGVYNIAGSSALGSYNIALGANAGQNRTNTSNQLFIGNYDATLFPQHLIEGVMGISQTLKLNAEVTVNSLAGSGTRMVVADASGVLSTQAIVGSGSQWTDNIGYNYLSANDPNLGGGDGLYSNGGYASNYQELVTPYGGVDDNVEFVYRVDPTNSDWTLYLPDPALFPNRVLNITNFSTDTNSGIILDGSYLPMNTEMGIITDYLSSVKGDPALPQWIQIMSIYATIGGNANYYWMVVKAGRKSTF